MNEFLEFIASIFNVSVDQINLDTEYNSIPEWDSLMQLRLVMEMEEKYGVQIDIDKIQDYTALRDFYNLVK